MDLKLPPESQRIVDYLKVNTKSVQTVTNVSLEEVREAYIERSKDLSGFEKEVFDGTREEVFIPSVDIKDGIPIFIYKPKTMVSQPAILVWCHGGGLVFGNRMLCDTACKRIASISGCIIVNVEYRLAPEHQFPAQWDDAQTIVEWVLTNKIKLGGSKSSKVGVGGDSGGGGIAASLAHDLPIDFQILVYPTVLNRKEYDSPSMQKFKDGPVITLARSQWISKQVVPPGEEANPRLCSILRTKFSHLPPALMLIAEIDLHNSGSWMYAEKLKENGVPVEVHEFEGALHAFFCYAAYCPEFCSQAYEKVARFIKKFQ